MDREAPGRIFGAPLNRNVTFKSNDEKKIIIKNLKKDAWFFLAEVLGE